MHYGNAYSRSLICSFSSVEYIDGMGIINMYSVFPTTHSKSSFSEYHAHLWEFHVVHQCEYWKYVFGAGVHHEQMNKFLIFYILFLPQIEVCTLFRNNNRLSWE